MKKTYRSAQGREVDMEKIRLQNEFVPAIGNMKVNARGDVLGPGGKIIKTREEVVDEIYKSKLSANTTKATEGPIPTRSPRPADQPIPTSSKIAKDFVPGSASADESTSVAVEEHKPSGLAKATQRAKKKAKAE